MLGTVPCVKPSQPSQHLLSDSPCSPGYLGGKRRTKGVSPWLGILLWGLWLSSPPPFLPPARALTTCVLCLNAGMVVPRVAPTQQRQGPPGGLQHLPEECPHPAAPSGPAAFGHLTLTRTAPGPDSSGQGSTWGGRGAGDLPLSPALPGQGHRGRLSFHLSTGK